MTANVRSQAWRTWIPAFAGMTIVCGTLAAQPEPSTVAAQPEQTEAAKQQPRPALLAAKASRNRLLDIASAGDHLVAVGEQGVILKSGDGTTWQQVQSPVDVMLTRLRFTDDKTGWALGYDATILKTIDGGQTWTVRHHDAAERALHDLMFLDATRGFSVGAYGSVYETVDGGETWTRRESELSALGMHFNAILQLGDGTLFIAGERGVMARSADRGATWQVLDFPYAGSIFGAIAHGDKGVLAYGMRGNVFESMNVPACPVTDVATWDPYTRENIEDPLRIEALGWRRLDNPVRESLFGALPTAGGAVLVGVNGTAVRIQSGTGSVSRLTTPATETLARLTSFKGRLFGVGRRGVIDLGSAP